MNELEQLYNQLLNDSGKIATAFSVIPIIIGCIFWVKLNKPLKIFLLYLSIRLFLNILIEIFIWSTTKYYNEFWKPILEFTLISDTNFFNGIFFLVDIIFCGYYFSVINEKPQNVLNFAVAKKILYLTAFLSVFQLLNYFLLDGFRSIGTIGNLLSTGFLLFLSIHYLWQISNNPPNIKLNKHPYFWISLAIFLPHLISIFYSTSMEMLYKSDFILFCKAQIARNLLQIICELMFAFAFLQAKYLRYI